MDEKYRGAIDLGVAILFIAPAAGRIAAAPRAARAPSDGFVQLFNGHDLTGWKIPAGDNGHWRVVDGVIDYDAESEAPGDKSLWTERVFRDFVLKVDWRLKGTPYVNPA